MDLELIDDSKLRSALPMSSAIDALDAAFSADRLPETPPRQHHVLGSGQLLLMPSWDASAAGVKLVTVAPDNPPRGLPLVQGVYVLFDSQTLAPSAVFDGAALTGLRTSAVSAVATSYLARPDSERLVVFGAGTQARWHVEAMRAVRDIRAVTIVSRSPERAHALADELKLTDASVGSPGEVSSADIVCTCTTSVTPVFEGQDLSPGTHVNAVGAFKPDTRELDAVAVGKSRVVVETRAAALAEAGDIILAIAEGAMTEDDIVADLQEVARGATPRTSEDDVTVFKSVGAAFEDLVIADACARALGI